MLMRFLSLGLLIGALTLGCDTRLVSVFDEADTKTQPTTTGEAPDSGLDTTVVQHDDAGIETEIDAGLEVADAGPDATDATVLPIEGPVFTLIPPQPSQWGSRWAPRPIWVAAEGDRFWVVAESLPEPAPNEVRAAEFLPASYPFRLVALHTGGGLGIAMNSTTLLFESLRGPATKVVGVSAANDRLMVASFENGADTGAAAQNFFHYTHSDSLQARTSVSLAVNTHITSALEVENQVVYAGVANAIAGGTPSQNQSWFVEPFAIRGQRSGADTLQVGNPKLFFDPGSTLGVAAKAKDPFNLVLLSESSQQTQQRYTGSVLSAERQFPLNYFCQSAQQRHYDFAANPHDSRGNAFVMDCQSRHVTPNETTVDAELWLGIAAPNAAQLQFISLGDDVVTNVAPQVAATSQHIVVAYWEAFSNANRSPGVVVKVFDWSGVLLNTWASNEATSAAGLPNVPESADVELFVDVAVTELQGSSSFLVAYSFPIAWASAPPDGDLHSRQLNVFWSEIQ